MADCLKITKGRNLGCKDAVGGYKNAYFINFDDSIVFNTSNGVVNSINGLTASEVYKYALKGTANTFQQDVTTSRDNGTTFYSQVLVLNLAKIDVEMTNQLSYMAAGSPFIVIEDNMGNYLLIGENNGADLSAGTIQTGGGLGDFNGYALTFTADEPRPVAHLSATASATLLSNVAPNS